MPLPQKLATVVGGRSATASSILGLFAKGEAGAWYDPSDLTSMYQDNGGVTQATIGQPVGLMLDKKYNLARGPELADTRFADPTKWLLSSGATCYATISNGLLTIVADNNATSNYSDAEIKNSTGSSFLPALANGWYEVVITVDSTSGGGIAVAVGNNQTAAYTAPGTYRSIMRAGANTAFAIKRAASATACTGVVSYFSCKQIPGNHLYQTGTARPTLKPDHYYGPNIFTNGGFDTLDLTNWNTIGNAGAVTVNASGQCVVTLPSSGMLNSGPETQALGVVAGKQYELEFDLVANPGNALSYIRMTSSAGAISGVSAFDIAPPAISRATTGKYSYRFTAPYSNPYLKFLTAAGTASATFTIDNVSVREVLSLGPELTPNLTTPTQTSVSGTTTSTSNSITFNSTSTVAEYISFTPAQVIKANTLYELTFTVLVTAGTVRGLFYGDNAAGAVGQYRSSGTFTEQLMVGAAGSFTQRLNFGASVAGTAATITNISLREVMPPRTTYLDLDGSDDSMFTPGAFDMGATPVVTVASGFRKPLPGASTVLLETSPDATNNSNSFSIVPPAQTGTVPIRFVTCGNTAGVYVSVDVADVSLTGIVPVIAVMQSDKNAFTTSARINGGKFSVKNSNSGMTAGNFSSTQQLFFGRRNNASLPFSGRMYGAVIRGTLSNAAEVSLIEKYFSQKMGLAL